MTSATAVRATRPGTARQSRAGRSSEHTVLLGLAGIATLALMLETLPRTGIVDPRFLPPFSEIVSALVQRAATAELLVALGQTLTTWAVGLAFAMAGGIMLGLVIGSVTFLREATTTIEFCGRSPPSRSFRWWWGCEAAAPCSRRSCWCSTPPSGRR